MNRRLALSAAIGAAVIAITAVRWLDQGLERSGPATSRPATGIAAPESPPAHQVLANVETHGTGPTKPVTRSSTAPPLLARLQAPTAASLGEVFDVVINLDAHRQVGRIAVALDYDPSRLRLVEATEGNFGSGRGTFSMEESSDGRVAVSVQVDEGTPLERSGSIAVMRFEALRQGGAQINVASIETSDTADNPMPSAVSVGQTRIAVQ